MSNDADLLLRRDERRAQLYSTHMEKTQALLNAIQEQLTRGCGDSRCSAALCITGRSKVSSRPIRKYTARAARAIALSVYRDPSLHKDLCKYYRPDQQAAGSSNGPLPNPDSCPRDPSSLMQLLCDTTSFQRPDTIMPPSFDSSCTFEDEVLSLHLCLDEWLANDEARDLFSSDDPAANSKIARFLSPMIGTLLEMSLSDAGITLDVIDRMLMHGRECPQVYGQDPDTNPYTYGENIGFLRMLRHKPALRFVGRIARLISMRTEKQKGLDVTDDGGSGGGSDTLADAILRDLHLGEFSVCALVIWLKTLFLSHWREDTEVEKRSICAGVLLLFKSFVRYEDYRSLAPACRLPPVSGRANPVELLTPILSSSTALSDTDLLSASFFYTSDYKAFLLRIFHLLKMQETYSNSTFIKALHQHTSHDDSVIFPDVLERAAQPYLLLHVRRDHVLRDAFDQLWQRQKAELSRPLRVRLGEEAHEIGQDLGGVQIEFFNLVCGEVMSDAMNVFTVDRETGLAYFSPGSLQPLHIFELVGLLFSLALSNGITLPVRLPIAFYDHLCSTSPAATEIDAIKWIADGWPTVARSLGYILDDDVEGLDFTYTIEANGLRMTVLMDQDQALSPTTWKVTHCTVLNPGPGDKVTLLPEDIDSIDWPGLKFISTTTTARSVDSTNKAAYITAYADWLTRRAVLPQLTAFMKGFRASGVSTAPSVGVFGPALLRQVLEGEDRFDVKALRAACSYDGYDADSPYMLCFWRVVRDWPEARQRRLLKFVTAVERLPMGGAANLTFVVKRAWAVDDGALPTSSTCFGTLHLPLYLGGQAVLARKLEIAVDYGAEGFGQG